MASPFPGMDPWLEAPGRWPDVHHRLISVAGDLLTEMLRPRYYARIEERIYISDETDPGRRVIAPDIAIMQRQNSPPARSAPGASAAVLSVAEPVEATTWIEEQIREPRIEIIERGQRVVATVIEVISPANKVPHSRGRESYARKRREVMNSTSHFIEIDLLRGGEAFGPVEELPRHDYRVHLSRANRRPRGMIWPIRLEQRLPIIPVPLLGDDPDAALDLQAVLATAYDRAAYDLEIDYHQPANPPLSPEQAEWAARLIH